MTENESNAASLYKQAVDQVTDAIDRLTASLATGPGRDLIAAGHPLVIELMDRLQRLTIMTRTLAERIDALPADHVGELLDRPSVERDERNTRADFPGDDDIDDDAARI